jgi:hypothetical protein
MPRACTLLFGSLLYAAAAAAQPSAADLATAAATVGQPTSIDLPTQAARVRGFRSAAFGMSSAEVRAAVARDFGAGPAAALAPETVEPGFTALTTRAPADEVGGEASLLYVFSDDSLVAVNVVRATPPVPTLAERQAIIDAAGRLTGRLLSMAWRPFASVRGRPLPGGQVIVLAAADDVGDGVEVRLVGVGYEARWSDGRTYASPTPTGGAALRVVYRRDIDGLAILKPGDF